MSDNKTIAHPSLQKGDLVYFQNGTVTAGDSCGGGGGGAYSNYYLSGSSSFVIDASQARLSNEDTERAYVLSLIEEMFDLSEDELENAELDIFCSNKNHDVCLSIDFFPDRMFGKVLELVVELKNDYKKKHNITKLYVFYEDGESDEYQIFGEDSK